MRVLRVFLAIGAVAMATSFFSCSSAKDPTVPEPNAPRITAVDPANPEPGPNPQVVTIGGQLFLTGLSLLVQAPDQVTTTFSGPQIGALRSSSFQVELVLDETGTYSLTVRNDNGSQSAAFPLIVRTTGPTTPVITAVIPLTIPRGAQAVQMTLQGQNFDPALSINMTNPAGFVTQLSGASINSVSPAQVQFSVVLSTFGVYSFTVTNPSGDTSNIAFINVT